MVFSRGANHRWSTDIDILHRVFQGAVVSRDRRRERVEVDDHQVNGRDIVVAHDLIVCTAAPKNAAMNFRVQGFDPAIHHLGEAGVIGDFRHGNPLIAQQPAGSACGENFNTSLSQRAGERHDAGFI